MSHPKTPSKNSRSAPAQGLTSRARNAEPENRVQKVVPGTVVVGCSIYVDTSNNGMTLHGTFAYGMTLHGTFAFIARLRPTGAERHNDMWSHWLLLHEGATYTAGFGSVDSWVEEKRMLFPGEPKARAHP